MVLLIKQKLNFQYCSPLSFTLLFEINDNRLGSKPKVNDLQVKDISKFYSSWKLEVNTKKSKIMIFNSNGKSFLNHFKLDNEYLETVKSYCYIGVTVSYTGNLSQTSKDLMEKGRKAWFKIKKTITLNNPCNLLEKLFDSLVVPIILYGSEVWGHV